MPLCGASRFCGCNLTSTPAVGGEIDGELPSIEVAGDGYGASPWNLTLNDGWAAAVADFVTETQPWIDGFGEEGTYTPPTTNLTIGTGGSAQNTARYRFFGGDQTGDIGLLQLEGVVTLGTSGAGVTGAIDFNIPSGFTLLTTHEPRPYTCRMQAGGGNYIGNVVVTASDELGINALRASGTYLDTVSTSATIPGAWAAGDKITWGGIWAAVRN